MVNSSPAPTPSYVIVVSGAPGSGKSTLTRNVAERLGNAVTFHFDHYDREADNSGPKDLKAWLAQGAHPDAWQRPRLISDLQKLRRGEVITNPRLGTPTEPASHIVMDGPFGRSWAPIRDLVDFVVCIDVPMEIALARRVVRTADHIKDSAAFHADIRRGMTHYLNGGWESYVRVLSLVKSECDLLVDGTKAPEEVADEVAYALRVRRQP
jgi:uridine kinase